MYNETKQRNRIVQWSHNKYAEVLRSQHPQAIAFETSRKININQTSNKSLKNWMYSNKEDLINTKVMTLGSILTYK